MKKKVIYHIARTKDDIEQAFALVYNEYVARGYIPKHYKSKLRISLLNALPSTSTFVAKSGGKVVATVTLIPDSPLGLPMDKLYKEEVDGLRKKGRKVSEVSQLSIDSSLFPRGWFSMFNFNKLMFVFKLFKLLYDYAIDVEKLNELCIAINPKQQYLYKFMYFEELGGLKQYGSVNKAPAIAKHLDLDETKKKTGIERKGLYRIFRGSKTVPEAFKNKFAFTTKDLEYFFIKKSDIFEKATVEQLDYIKSCYPKEHLGAIFRKIGR